MHKIWIVFYGERLLLSADFKVFSDIGYPNQHEDLFLKINCSPAPMLTHAGAQFNLLAKHNGLVISGDRPLFDRHCGVTYLHK